MGAKRSPGRYSDSKFIAGFGRYVIAELIVDASSQGEFEERIRKYYSDRSDGIFSNIWEEYRILNLVGLIEHQLCSTLWQFKERSYFKSDFSSFRKFVIGRIAKYQKLENESKATQLLYNASYNKRKRDKGSMKTDDTVCTPYILLDVAGFSIGDFVGIFGERIQFDFSPGEILEDLKVFSLYRHHLFHNLTSSRRDYRKLLREGPEIGKRLLTNLKHLSSHLSIGQEWYMHDRRCPWCTSAI